MVNTDLFNITFLDTKLDVNKENILLGIKCGIQAINAMNYEDIEIQEYLQQKKKKKKKGSGKNKKKIENPYSITPKTWYFGKKLSSNEYGLIHAHWEETSEGKVFVPSSIVKL